MKIKIIYFLLLFFFIKVSSQVPAMVKDVTYTPVSVVDNWQPSSDKYKIAVKPDGVMYIYSAKGLRKVLSSGLNDNSFGSLGFQTNVIQWLDVYSRIVIKGQYIYLSNNTEIGRYDFNGNLDLSFGSNGKISLAGIQSFNVNEDQSIYVWGGNTIKKLTPSGTIDSSFSEIGSVSIYSVTNDNKLIIYKTTSTDSVFRYDSQGNLDSSFANNGQLIPVSAGEISSIYSLRAVPTGEIIITLAKVSGGTTSYYSKKYLINGNLDTAFGVNGTLTPSLGGVVFDGNGNMLKISVDRVWRYTPNGMPDTTFHAGTSSFYVPVGSGGIPGGGSGINYLVDIFVVDSDKLLVLRTERLSLNMRNYIMDQYVKVTTTLNTSEVNHKNEISFNNPFNNELTFNTNEKIKQVEIFDESGRLVLKEANKNKLNTDHLTKGVYFIKITKQSGEVISKKAIKN